MEPRVLITGGDRDPHIESVTRALEGRGVEWARIDTAALPEAPVTYRPGEGAATAAGLDLTRYNAVWYRRSYDPRLPTVDPEALPYAQQEYRELFQGELFSLRAHWVDHPVAIRVANCKPFQLHLAGAAGLRIPDTVITSDPEAARAFVDAHGAEGVIAKGIGPPVLQVDGMPKGCYAYRLDGTSVQRLDDLRFGPCILQAFVPKAFEARVTVVGDEVFAARMDTASVAAAEVDWRLADYRQIPHAAMELPPRIRRGCLRLCRRLDLRYGALDFVVDFEGRWHFLEVNPSGQWAWVERMAGLPIGEAIAAELCRGAGAIRRAPVASRTGRGALSAR